MFLTDEEIAELTGYQKPAWQIRWLKNNHWPMSIDANDRPKVLRSVVLARLGDCGKVATEPRLHLAK